MANKPVKNSGLIYEEDDPKDYILGSTSPLKSPPIIFPDGHGWHNETIRAKSEMQFNNHFDSYSCVIFTIAKGLVAYLKKVYGVTTTVSEMFNAIVGGVVPNRGTTIRKGLEGFRNYGWVEDKDYPFTIETTLKQFFQKPSIEIYDKAKQKLTKWKIHWEGLETSGNVSHAKIIEELKRSIVIATGYAWSSYKGIYYDYNQRANHAFPIDDWIEDNEHADLLAYDSYPQDNQFDENSSDDEFVKKLGKTYRVWSAHRIWLTPVNNSLINKIMDFFVRLKNGAIFWGKRDTNKIQKITKENAGLAAITHIMRQEGVNTINIDDEALKNYVITDEFFGSDNLGINKKL